MCRAFVAVKDAAKVGDEAWDEGREDTGREIEGVGATSTVCADWGGVAIGIDIE